MKQNYFIYNDIKYHENTVIVLSRFDCMSRKLCDTKAKFRYYNTETEEYVVEIYGKEHIYKKNKFENDLISIYGISNSIRKESSVTNVKHTFSDELNIDTLLLAWIWYIFIMVVGIIFHNRIVIWVLASIVFFNYRYKKLKEVGYR